MECYVCSKDSRFICLCSNIYLCQKHLGKHLDTPGDHQFDKISIQEAKEEFPTAEQKTEINNRIKIILSAREKINYETKEAILSIKSQSKSVLKKLDALVNKFIRLFSKIEFEEYEENELKDLLGRSLVITNLDLSLDDYIIDAYSQVTIKQDKISKIDRLDILNSWTVKEKLDFLRGYMDIEVNNAVDIIFSNDKTYAFHCKD